MVVEEGCIRGEIPRDDNCIEFILFSPQVLYRISCRTCHRNESIQNFSMALHCYAMSFGCASNAFDCPSFEPMRMLAFVGFGNHSERLCKHVGRLCSRRTKGPKVAARNLDQPQNPALSKSSFFLTPKPFITSLGVASTPRGIFAIGLRY